MDKTEGAAGGFLRGIGAGLGLSSGCLIGCGICAAVVMLTCVGMAMFGAFLRPAHISDLDEACAKTERQVDAALGMLIEEEGSSVLRKWNPHKNPENLGAEIVIPGVRTEAFYIDLMRRCCDTAPGMVWVVVYASEKAYDDLDRAAKGETDGWETVLTPEQMEIARADPRWEAMTDKERSQLCESISGTAFLEGQVLRFLRSPALGVCTISWMQHEGALSHLHGTETNL